MKLSSVNPLTLPSSPEVEHSVLCSFIIRSTKCAPIIGEAGTHPDHFHNHINRLVFETGMELWLEKQEFDHLTLTQRLREKGKLSELGANGVWEYLDKTGICPTDAQLKEHLKVLEGVHKKRQTHLLCVDYAKRSLNGEDSENLVAGLVERAMALSEGRREFRSTREVVRERLEEMMAIALKQKKVQAQTTGISQLDKALCGGMRPGDFVLVSAETKGGKSILAHNIAEHAACHQGKPVMLFSLEMTADDVIDRMIASVTLTDFTRMRNGWLEVPELKRMAERIALISRSNLIVRDDLHQLGQIAASIRNFKNLYPDAACAIIDYVQLIDVEMQKGENREMAIAKISTTLRRLSNTLKLPIIILAQENGDGRARESRRLEQDCTTWVRLRKDEGDPKKNIEPNENIRHCDIKLNRNGPPCTFKLTYRPQYLRLENHTEEYF